MSLKNVQVTPPLRFVALSLGIYDRFKLQLPAGYSVRHNGPLRLADSEPEPDVAIVRGSDSDFLDRHPATAALVVEVAISSVALDRENAGLYAEAGVEEHWIIMPREQQIEVYRKPEAGTYRDVLVVREGTLECVGIPGVTVVLADIFG